MGCITECLVCGKELPPSDTSRNAKKCSTCRRAAAKARKAEAGHPQESNEGVAKKYIMDVIRERGAISRNSLRGMFPNTTIRSAINSLTWDALLYDITDGEGRDRIYTTLDTPELKAIVEAGEILAKGKR